MKRYSLILALIVQTLCANTIYTYTGNDFTQVSGSGGPTTSDFITISFETVSSLPGNLLNYPGSGPMPWRVSDGVNALSSRNTNDAMDLSVDTDELGNIVHWDIQGLTKPFSLWIVTFNPPYTCCPGPIDQSDTFGNGEFMDPTAISSNADTPGTWTVTSDVPEPGVWMMLTLGLCTLGLCRHLIATVTSFP
jgi:hypothetical protein